MDPKTRHIYAAYKRLTSDLKTHRLKVRGWKNIPCKWKSKEIQSSNS